MSVVLTTFWAFSNFLYCLLVSSFYTGQLIIRWKTPETHANQIYVCRCFLGIRFSLEVINICMNILIAVNRYLVVCGAPGKRMTTRRIGLSIFFIIVSSVSLGTVGGIKWAAVTKLSGDHFFCPITESARNLLPIVVDGPILVSIICIFVLDVKMINHIKGRQRQNIPMQSMNTLSESDRQVNRSNSVDCQVLSLMQTSQGPSVQLQPIPRPHPQKDLTTSPQVIDTQQQSTSTSQIETLQPATQPQPIQLPQPFIQKDPTSLSQVTDSEQPSTSTFHTEPLQPQAQSQPLPHLFFQKDPISSSQVMDGQQPSTSTSHTEPLQPPAQPQPLRLPQPILQIVHASSSQVMDSQQPTIHTQPQRQSIAYEQVNNFQRQTLNHMTKSLLATTLSFAIIWACIFILPLCFKIVLDRFFDNFSSFMADTLLHLSHTIPPFILAYVNVTFRQSFWRLIGRIDNEE